MQNQKQWRIWIDRGGTFTDCIGVDQSGETVVLKLLSENPDRYQDSILESIRQITGAWDVESIDASLIKDVRIGTTIATNALLERKGEKIALAVTKGFKDALWIGDQRRNHLFKLHIERPPSLYDEVVEIDERIDANGKVLKKPDLKKSESLFQKIRDKGFSTIVIHLLNAYQNPGHEKILTEIARKAGFKHVYTGHQTTSEIQYISRGHTALIDAYLSPILKDYIENISKALPEIPITFMQSSGILAPASAFHGKDAILSGPAGGIIGAAAVGKTAKQQNLVTFDMGGTSTDVAHYAGTPERQQTALIEGWPVLVPMMNIHTVAAGGGSICHFDGERYRVGPQSAGASPGPACYGRDGPLTITDCNLLTGRLQKSTFPAIFGKKSNQPLNKEAATLRAEEMAETIQKATGQKPTIEELAYGFLRVANESMARAIRRISLEKGHNIKTHALVSFGGAGGQHATAIADLLGIETVLLHPLAGVLSAAGIGMANAGSIKKTSFLEPLTQRSLQKAEKVQEKQAEDLKKDLVRQFHHGKGKSITKSWLGISETGSNTVFEVPLTNLATVKSSFQSEYKKAFGFEPSARTLTIQAIGSEVIIKTDTALPQKSEQKGFGNPTQKPFYDGTWHHVPLLWRGTLKKGKPVKGPAIISENQGTIIVEKGWQALLDTNSILHLTRLQNHKTKKLKTTRDPVLLSVFNSRFMSIAEQMGAVLERTAHSVNIKERLDFSCAVFDCKGNLVANAPHMPVHLGSMGESIQAIIQKHRKNIKAGDVYVINNPYNGGTHLPDITVVSPVFVSGKGVDFFVASRGHHADVGGITPGSMPAFSQTLEEEGIVFDGEKIVHEETFDEGLVRDILNNHRYPARNINQNIADLKAQIAALRTGEKQLAVMVKEFGFDVVKAYMGHIQDNAAEAVERTIHSVKEGKVTYTLDNGAHIRLKITKNKKTSRVTLDFTGTSKAGAHNFNAPLAVTKAAVLFAFRAMVDDDIPMNAGCMRPIDMIVPQGCLLNPDPPHAVCAGNVETSQALTNAILLAAGALAAGQGTMNNLTLGNSSFQYYETLGGGSGAGKNFDGMDAVHTHMTNSKLTDPEILELRTPLLVKSFSIRPNSGGTGKYRGGNGLVRQLQAREKMEVSILSSHRKEGPEGLDGGTHGYPGENIVHRHDGTQQKLKASDHTILKPGDIIEIRTPGGGGYGKDIHQ